MFVSLLGLSLQEVIVVRGVMIQEAAANSELGLHNVETPTDELSEASSFWFYFGFFATSVQATIWILKAVLGTSDDEEMYRMVN